MEKLTIKRSEWLHGEGINDSYLLRERDGKKCCLGFWCLAVGVPAEKIVQQTTPALLDEVPEALGPLVDRSCDDDCVDGSDHYTDSEVCTMLTQLNDTPLFTNEHGYYLTSEVAREDYIARVFRDECGLEVEFVD